MLMISSRLAPRNRNILLTCTFALYGTAIRLEYIYYICNFFLITCGSPKLRLTVMLRGCL